MDAITIGCVIVGLGLVVSPVVYILNGWVLSIMWGWFLVPLGAPMLSVAQAIGVSLIVGFLVKQTAIRTHKDDREPSEKLSDAVAALIIVFLAPFVTLGVGWIVQSFIVA